jgi:hypothetical protein
MRYSVAFLAAAAAVAAHPIQQEYAITPMFIPFDFRPEDIKPKDLDRIRLMLSVS